MILSGESEIKIVTTVRHASWYAVHRRAALVLKFPLSVWLCGKLICSCSFAMNLLNLIFHHSQVFIPKVADSLLLSPISSSASLPPPSTSVVSCHSEGERCWREEHMWGGRGGDRGRKGGGELILEPRNDWLVVSEWQGMGPLPGASVPHTQKHTRQTQTEIWTFIHNASWISFTLSIPLKLLGVLIFYGGQIKLV